jgi:hypothetical protein
MRTCRLALAIYGRRQRIQDRAIVVELSILGKSSSEALFVDAEEEILKEQLQGSKSYIA